jgi:hypothetical protein
MTTIFVEREKLNNIKKELDLLIENSLEAKPDAQKIIAQQTTSFLPKKSKEQRIFAYVKKNEGISKQKVADYFNDKSKNTETYSRVPIFHGIENLVKYGMLTVKADEKNSQVHRLYINKQSVILSIQEDIKTMKDALLKLMYRSAEIYKDSERVLQESSNSTETVIQSVEFDIDNTFFIVQIFKHLVSIYAQYAIFEWPRQIKDQEVLSRLYLTVFQQLQEILSDIERFVPFDATKQKRPRYLQAYLRFYPGEFKSLIFHSHKYNMNDEFNDLMDVVWKIDDIITPKDMPRDWKMASKIIRGLNTE